MKKFYYFFALLMCVLGVQNVSAKKAVTVTADSDLSTLAYTMEALEGVEVTKADGTVTLYTNPESFGLGHPLMVDETDAVVVKIKDGFKVVKCIINDELQDVPFPGSFTVPTENIHVWVACAPMKSYEIPYVIDGKGGTCIDPVVFMSKGDHNAPLTELSHSGTRGAVYPTEFADVLIIKPNAETNGYIKKVVFTTEDGEVEGVADGDGEYSIALEGLVSVYIEANEVDRNETVKINFDKNPQDLTHMVDVTGAKNDILLDFNAYSDPKSNVQLPGVGDNIVKVDAGYDLPLTLNINNKYNSASKVYAVNADGTKEEIEPAYTGGHVFVITTLDGIAQFNVEIGEPVRDTEFTLTANKKFADAVYYLDVAGATHMDVAAQIDTNERPATLYNSNADADKTSEDGKTATFKASMSWDMPMTVHYQLKDADNRSIDRLFVVAEDGTKTEITNRDANGFVVSAEDLAGATDLYLQFGVRDTNVKISVDKDLTEVGRAFTAVSRIDGNIVNFINFKNDDVNGVNANSLPYPAPMNPATIKIDVNEDYPLDITCVNVFNTEAELVIVAADGKETSMGKANHWTIEKPLADGESIKVYVGEPKRETPVKIWVDKDIVENTTNFSVEGARIGGQPGAKFFDYVVSKKDEANVPAAQTSTTFYINEEYDLPLVVRFYSTIDGNQTSKVVVKNNDGSVAGAHEYAQGDELDIDPATQNIAVYLGLKRDAVGYARITEELLTAVQKAGQYISIDGSYCPTIASTGLSRGENLVTLNGTTLQNAVAEPEFGIRFNYDPTCDLPLNVSFYVDTYTVGGVNVVNEETGTVTEAPGNAAGNTFVVANYDGTFETLYLYLKEVKPKHNTHTAFLIFNENLSDVAYTFSMESGEYPNNYVIANWTVNSTWELEPYGQYYCFPFNEDVDNEIVLTTNYKTGLSVFVTVNGVDVQNEQPGTSAAKFIIKNLKQDDIIDVRYYDVAVGIDSVNANKLNGKIYTINGVEVKEATQPGLYIVNGKKVVVK